MRLTRQHFKLIAEAVDQAHGRVLDRMNVLDRVDANASYQAGADTAFAVLRSVLADALAETNPAFDRSRFLDACQVTLSRRTVEAMKAEKFARLEQKAERINREKEVEHRLSMLTGQEGRDDGEA